MQPLGACHVLARVGLRGQLQGLGGVGPGLVVVPLGQGQLPKRVQQRYVPAPAQPGIFLQQRLGAAEARLGRAVLTPIQVGQASFHQGMAARLWPGIEPLRHLVSLQVEPERFVEIE